MALENLKSAYNNLSINNTTSYVPLTIPEINYTLPNNSTSL